MKTKRLAICLFSIWGSVAAWAANEVGNGGHAVVCGSPPSKYFALDRWEAENRSNRVIDLGPSPKAKNMVVYALARLDGVSKILANQYRVNLKRLEESVEFLTNVLLPQSPDMGSTTLPNDCLNTKQVILRTRPEFDGDKEFHVSKDIWDKLSEVDRAILLLHEVVYMTNADRKTSPHATSRRSRHFVGLIASNDILKYKGQPEAWLKFLVSIGMPIAQNQLGQVICENYGPPNGGVVEHLSNCSSHSTLNLPFLEGQEKGLVIDGVWELSRMNGIPKLNRSLRGVVDQGELKFALSNTFGTVSVFINSGKYFTATSDQLPNPIPKSETRIHWNRPPNEIELAKPFIEILGNAIAERDLKSFSYLFVNQHFLGTESQAFQFRDKAGYTLKLAGMDVPVSHFRIVPGIARDPKSPLLEIEAARDSFLSSSGGSGRVVVQRGQRKVVDHRGYAYQDR